MYIPQNLDVFTKWPEARKGYESNPFSQGRQQISRSGPSLSELRDNQEQLIMYKWMLLPGENMEYVAVPSFQNSDQVRRWVSLHKTPIKFCLQDSHGKTMKPPLSLGALSLDYAK